MNMLMLDVCSGLEGASQAMKEHAWQVVTVDNDPAFNPIICADIRKWTWTGNRPTLIWCSPPCTEFSREFMPWSKTGKEPDMSLVLACIRIVMQAAPRYWVIENVKGSLKYIWPILGKPTYVCNPYYLWGHFPDINHVRVRSNKEHLSSRQAAERAKIPYSISKALAEAIEIQMDMEI
jgi:hypothetical protein